MKTLYILRHAQKDMTNQELDDYDIPLTNTGIKDVEKLALKIKEKNLIPDAIMSSPAQRTRQTAQIISSSIDFDRSIMYKEVIYKAFLNELVETITYTYDTFNSLLLVGHNPALNALAISLCGYKERLEMGELIQINFECDSWLDINKTNAKFIEHLKP